MRLLITFIQIMLFNITLASEIQLFKFISANNDTIKVYVKDIVEIDTSNNLIKLTEGVAKRIKDINAKAAKVYFYSTKWEVLYVISVYSSERELTREYIQEHRMCFLFYSDVHILLAGDFAKELVARYKLPVNR
ncbi:MAG: hypothetical protein IH948_01060 [Bacteroidetes bacterium]|nr:hypothetical protein [Bacteroidota bacterium]